MSMFVLDTDMLTLFRNGHPAVVAHALRIPPAELFVSVITVEEQLQGWYRILHRDPSSKQVAERYQRLADTVSFYSATKILNFTESAADLYGRLERLKLNVKPFDLRIAAIALDNSATVVTRNVRDFRRVPDLVIEDWSRSAAAH